MISVKKMPMFVHIIESFDTKEITTVDYDMVNKDLSTIQKKGGKIIDIKLSTCSIPESEGVDAIGEICRTYLILYEAVQQLV